MVAWKHLRHPNVLPLLGVNLEPNRYAMVFEWMENGNINEFTQKHKEVNRVQLVSARVAVVLLVETGLIGFISWQTPHSAWITCMVSNSYMET